jgi:crossover junction endodeoxyribonuclease RusA
MHIRINGIPAPQGSKRHVGNGVMIESSKAVGPWRDAVRRECQLVTGGQVAYPRPAALVINISFILPRPVGHLGLGRNTGKPKPSAPDYPAVKPDIDKLQRAVLDGLTAGGAFTDDAQVVSVLAVKSYAGLTETTGCDIWIQPAKPINRE